MAKTKQRTLADVLNEIPARLPPGENAWLLPLPKKAKDDLFNERKAFQNGSSLYTKADLYRAAKSLYGIRCGETTFKRWLGERGGK